MTSRMTITIGLLVATAVSGQTQAQTAWNRKVEAISVLPDGNGAHDIIAYYEISADDPLTVLDLSTEIEVRVNGTAIDIATTPFSAEPGGGCGVGCLTNQACVCCEITPGEVICSCGSLIAPNTSSGASMESGDEIMVLLRPAAGALPENDPSDDIMVITFLGDDIYWNRRIAGVAITPSSGGGPAGGPFFDIDVDVAIEGNYDGLLHLPAELELQVNGSAVATSPVAPFDLDLLWTQCSNVPCDDTIACVMDPAGPSYGSCQPDPDGPLSCSCTYHPVPLPAFPAVLLDPDDEIVLILKPVPGALPELPGFPDDEERPEVPAPCLGDLDGDGHTNTVDLLALLAAWGECPEPCPPACAGDFDGDCQVNVVDLLELLSAWGPCGGPV